MRTILFLTLLAVLIQTDPSAAILEGTVIVRGTTATVAAANIELRAVGSNPPRSYYAESSDDGQFKITNIAPGRYRIFAAREGYISGEYGQNHLNTPGIVIDIAAGARLTQMNVTLATTGAISGRISWPTGKPQGIALVDAYRVSYEEGRRTFVVVQSTRTDDLGNYRLFWLPPGRYFLSATPPNGPIDPTITWNTDATNASLSLTRENRRTVLTRPVIANANNEIFAPIYYPGSPDDKKAVPIEVVGGSEVRGMDIVAGYVPSYRVRGVIVDSDTGEVVKNAQVRASIGNQSGIVSLDQNTGAFSLGYLTPGSEYVLTANAGSKSGRFRFLVTDHDFEIRVPIYSSFQVSGRLIVDGRPAEAKDVAGMRFLVQGQPVGIGGLQPTGSFAEDGSFTFAVVPGDYLVNVSPILNRTGVLVGNIPLGNIPGRTLPVNTAFNVPVALKDVYVKSMRFGDRDVLNEGLHLQGPAPEVLEIHISTRAGTLEGAVQDSKGRSFANALTVLVPDAALRHRPDLYKVTRTDAAGRFSFDRIPAGSYSVFAWDNILDGSWRDADVMREYDGRGSSVLIEDGKNTKANLTLIESPAQ